MLINSIFFVNLTIIDNGVFPYWDESNKVFLSFCSVIYGLKFLSFDNDLTNTHMIGNVLYTEYIHLFQVSGIILLLAMIGAIVLTFRQREGVKTQSYLKQISRERSEGVEVLEVPSNRGVKIDD